MSSEAYRRNYLGIQWTPTNPSAKTAKREGRPFYIVPDINPYRSAITGEVITSRSKHREHLREHGVIEVGNEKLKPHEPTPPPDLNRDIREAFDMVRQGYKPRPIGTFRED